MFGLSFAEIMVILLVALVVIGPEELPVVIRTVKQLMAKVKELGSEVMAAVSELDKDGEIRQIVPEIKDSISLNQEVLRMNAEIKDLVDKAYALELEQKQLEQQAVQDGVPQGKGEVA